MDFCNECGSKTDPDWVFCRSCGNPLDSSEIEAVAVQPIAATRTPKVELISRGWDVVEIDATEADSDPGLHSDALESDDIVSPLDPDAVEISVDEVTVVARPEEAAESAADEGEASEAAPETDLVPETDVATDTDVPAETDLGPETALAPATDVGTETDVATETDLAADTDLAIDTDLVTETEAAPEAGVATDTSSDRWDHLRPHGYIPGVSDPSRLPAKISQIAVLVAAFSALAAAVLYLILNIQLEQFAAGDVSEGAIRDVRAVAEASLLVTAGLTAVSLIMFVWWMFKARSRGKLRPGLAGLIALPAWLGGGALIGYFALLERSTVADALTANSLIIIGLGLLMLACLATIRIVSRVEIRDRW